jgi:hypothetical protein
VEIERLADGVVRGAWIDAEVGEMREKAAECRAIGQQDRVVIQAPEAAFRHRPRAGPRVQRHQRRVVSLYP